MITLSVTRHSVERYTTSTRITVWYVRIINIINSFKTIIIGSCQNKYHKRWLGVI